MQKLLHLDDELHQRVIGQDEAVDAVAEAVMRARSGLKDPNRPIGSFIFLGPTGVGKTELARALAEFLFDDERAMIRIDMSEYQEKHTRRAADRRAARLRRLRRRRPADRSGAPASVLASCCSTRSRRRTPTCSTCFLQILDDGRLTDGQGRTVDFKNTIVIMTSNIGSHRILDYHGRRERAPTTR